jgi:hypothetical protein
MSLFDPWYNGVHSERPYFGGQIVTARTTGDGTKVGRDVGPMVKPDRGCKHYSSCLQCPFDYCIRHEKEFGIPNDRLAR